MQGAFQALAVAVWLIGGGCADAQGTTQPAVQQTSGQISGTLVDANGALLRDAQVSLTRDDSPDDLRQTKTDASGHFSFSGVRVGSYRVTATAPRFTAVTVTGAIGPGQVVELPVFRLDVAATDTVQVVASQQELAKEEVKAEEQQRLGGLLPNFFVAYDWKAPALTPKQKFDLAWKNSIDPGNLIVNAGIAGIQQATNQIDGYGQGAAGYGKRLGADEADLAAGTFLGGAVLPVLFHQDPRYFWKGTGTIKSRALYAISTAFRARGDNGKWQPAYASMLGDIGAGAMSNIWYPAENRTGVALTFENGFINIGYDALGNLVQEFLLRHLTPHPPVYGTMDKD